ncbi:MAG: helix-turn-helix domain-containing protein [Acidobacteriota bacterium]|nr:helix-turn-helix domain-containing protein [Acidobacteriota bacterium]
MSRPALRIEVVKKDQRELEKMLSGGVQPVRAVLRAMALLQLAKGISAPRIAGFIPLTPQAIRKVGHRYAEGGFKRAVYEKERPGAAALLEDSQKQRIIAMVCGGPPEGHARWTVRLVAEQAVKRRLVPRVGRETIRVLLLSHDLKPWREKNVVRPGTHRRVHRKDGGCAGDVRADIRSCGTGDLSGREADHPSCRSAATFSSGTGP